MSFLTFMPWRMCIAICGIMLTMCSQSDNDVLDGDTEGEESDIVADAEGDSDSDVDMDSDDNGDADSDDDSDDDADSDDDPDGDADSDDDPDGDADSDDDPDGDADSDDDPDGDADSDDDPDGDADSDDDPDTDEDSDDDLVGDTDDTDGDTDDTDGDTDDTDGDTDDTDGDTDDTDGDTDDTDGDTDDTDGDTDDTNGNTDNDTANDTNAELSSGCGVTAHLESGQATIDVSGTQRDYILKIPENYDPNTAYKLIVGWHWRGGSMNDVVSGGMSGGAYYGLEALAGGTAIFVAPDGIDDGWANPGGRDIEFLRAMLERFNSGLCIDQKRIFSTGFSYGGMMSFAVGCAMSDVFRAIAPMSGALYSGCEQGNTHPIAVWMAHGDGDTVVPLTDGQAGIDVFLEKNGCSNETIPVEPSPCVAYQGCDEGYPVHYCEFSGGHGPASFGPEGTWNFFNQF